MITVMSPMVDLCAFSKQQIFERKMFTLHDNYPGDKR